MYIADLHIHSRFSRATSRELDLPHLDLWARRKGIQVVGTGDFTHPAWRSELRDQLLPAEDGLFTLRPELRIPDPIPGPDPRFLLSVEISSIYKKNGRTRKVHNVILLPTLEAADQLSARLEAIGNIRSDGRPILGLDCKDLLALTLETCPEAELIPAHIWTPHFSVFGAFSGFDTLEECFEDLTPHIHALETGLSSDPPMNWRVSALDRYTLVSHSDAHSPAKLGREADLLDTSLSYPELVQAIRTGTGFSGTLEFFPEEGKYHLDGHRNCHCRLEPAETVKLDGKCPVCGKPVTIGVQHRVEELADRPEGFVKANAKPFESLVPLPEVIGVSMGCSPTGKQAEAAYFHLLRRLGPEFYILREAPVEDIEQEAGPCVAEGIRRLRAGKVQRLGGYDGEFGTVTLLDPSEIEALSGQTSLFGVRSIRRTKKASAAGVKKAGPPKEAPAETPAETLNEAQRRAVELDTPVIAVVAGPGTGKTKTLAARIGWLVAEQGVKPASITAVTFTNQAAAELRSRLEDRLGRRTARAMTIGTFHAICLGRLGQVPLIGGEEAQALAGEAARMLGLKLSPRRALQGISKIKNGMAPDRAGASEALCGQYGELLKARGVRDLDDLLLDELAQGRGRGHSLDHLLVDEFQDCNPIQYQLIRQWSQGGKSLFVIGDPDQSIYGFRGADAACFDRLSEDFPQLETVTLTENYRSAPEVLDCALSVIRANPGAERVLHPNRPGGVPVRLVQACSDFSEAVWIAKEIGQLVGGVGMLEAQKHGAKRGARAFSDLAVLCRTRRQLRLLEQCLRHDSIPCVISGRESDLGEDSVLGALGFFRALLEPKNRNALESALKLVWSCPADLADRAAALCGTLEEFDLEALRAELGSFGHLTLWLEEAAYFLPLTKRKPRELMELWAQRHGGGEALERLARRAVFYDRLPAFLNGMLLGEEADIRRTSGAIDSGAVRLMTLHGAKGLEFPVVFLAGVSQGVLPLEAQDRTTDLEEERRLLFVGMTRAREELILTTGRAWSPFLDPLPEAVLRERAGAVRQAAEESAQLSLFS